MAAKKKGKSKKRKLDYPALTAADCVEALQKKYTAPAFALLEQVANGTGYSVSNWADAVAMSLWPSRGLSVHGFEIKVSRSDWLQELKKPRKSAAVQQHCDFWWIVAPVHMIEPHELPPTWGMLGVSSAKVARVVVAAPRLECPELLSRAFVAAILRRQAEALDAIVARERRRATCEGEDRASLVAQVKTSVAEMANLQRRIQNFEASSGLTVGDWNGAAVGKAVRVVMERERMVEIEQRVRRDMEAYEELAGRMRSMLERLEKERG